MVYNRHDIGLSDGQKQKLYRAYKNGNPLNIRLTHSQLTGDSPIDLTRTQTNSIEKAKSKGVGLVLKLSGKQIVSSMYVDNVFGTRDFELGLTDGQKKKILNAKRTGCPVNLWLTPSQVRGKGSYINISNHITIKEIIEAKKKGLGLKLRLSGRETRKQIITYVIYGKPPLGGWPPSYDEHIDKYKPIPEFWE